MHFRVFSEGQGTEWRIFLGCLKFKYLFGGLEILDIFFFLGGGGMVDAGPEPTYEKNGSTPPPPAPGFVHQFKPISVKCI